MQINPMLAGKVSEEKLELLWEDDNWVAEEKFDGSRYIMQIREGGNILTSRRNSVKTGQNVDKTGNVPHITGIKYPELYGTVIDGEITAPNKDFTNVLKIMGSLPEKAIEVQKEIGKAEYWVFDILYYKGRDVQKEPYQIRRQFVYGVVEEMRKKSKEVMRVLMWEGNKKRKCYEDIIANGGEGIILKNKFGIYEQDKRSHGWIKVKKTVTDDVVIMGFTEAKKWYAEPGTAGADEIIYPNGRTTKFYDNGWIGAIKYGKYKEKELVEIGQCSGVSDEMRAEFTNNQKKYIGKTMEIVAQLRFKDGGYRHGNFVRLRPDKHPKECKEK